MTTRRPPATAAALALILALAGCGEPEPPKVQPRETLGKTTQRVFDLDEELAKGAQIASGKIENYDPISGPGQLYVKTTGTLTADLINSQYLEIYNIENNRYPRDVEEFKEGILKVGQPDGVFLPERPYYQEYAYDAANHRLVVLEYPERKAQMQKQMDEKLGR